MARPVRIATARSANVLAARQAAKTVHVLAASRKSTKIQEKNEEINKIFTIVILKNILTWIKCLNKTNIYFEKILVKVSKSQNKSMKSSFLPKNE